MLVEAEGLKPLTVAAQPGFRLPRTGRRVWCHRWIRETQPGQIQFLSGVSKVSNMSLSILIGQQPLPFCRGHYLQSISSLFSVDLTHRKVLRFKVCTNVINGVALLRNILGDACGDLTSGLGATGWTGRVCLAASFFRLTRLFSNISWTELCFWKTLSTWSWWKTYINMCHVDQERDDYYLFNSDSFPS